MLNACVRRFDMTGTVGKILGTKQGPICVRICSFVYCASATKTVDDAWFQVDMFCAVSFTCVWFDTTYICTKLSKHSLSIQVHPPIVGAWLMGITDFTRLVGASQLIRTYHCVRIFTGTVGLITPAQWPVSPLKPISSLIKLSVTCTGW